MALSKNTRIIIFIIIAVIVIAAVLIYVFRCKLFPSLSSCVPDPNKNNTPVPPGSPTTQWIPEKFPLDLGMYGTKIRALQIALGFTGNDVDGKFGNIKTKPAVIALGYSVPLSESDYNKIIAGKDTSNPIGQTAYASHNGVAVYKISDSSIYKTAAKDEYIGKITGEYANDSAYWTIANLYRVYKQSVYYK